MKNFALAVVAVVVGGMVGAAAAQPRVVVLNPGAPQGISDNGQTAFGGGSSYGIGLSSLTVGALGGVSPDATQVSNDGLFASGTVNFEAARWSVAAGAWTAIPTGGVIEGVFQAPRDLSASGRYAVGQCSTTDGGFAGYVCDFGQNPPVTTALLGHTATARACGVSADGRVIVGGESPNYSGLDEGGRAGVWRWNAGANSYDWSYLPDGPVDGSGGIVFRTVDNFLINDAGTVIVGNSYRYDAAAGYPHQYLTRWVWNATSSSWIRTDLYNMDTGELTISSWWTPLPDCPLPPQFFPTAMTNDGQTIVGILEYSTCGSFVRGGFIYAGGAMLDLNDYLVSLGVDLQSAGFGTYSVDGFGLSHLGYAYDISDDGLHLVGAPAFDPDTPGSWLIDLDAPGAGCIPPVVTADPPAETNISACSGMLIFNSTAAGSPSMTMQWSKDGVDIFDGPSGNGSTYQILGGGKSLWILPPITQQDAGTFRVRVTNGCGSASSAGAVVRLDPGIPPASNDTCATAQPVTMGVNILGGGQSACGAWVDEPLAPSCSVDGAVRADLWYVFTPPATQEYRLETCGANFDTVLTVYSDCLGTEVACSDGITTGPGGDCSSDRARIASVRLTAGVPYLIRIAAGPFAYLWEGSVANLSITAAPAPVTNDTCESATPAVVGVNPFDTTEASADWPGTSCSGYVGRDVFFSYTPAQPGRLTLATCPGTGWGTVLSIHSGLCGPELACNDNSDVTDCWSQSLIENFPVQAGTTYMIRVGVDSPWTGFGPGVLTLTFSCAADFNGDGFVDFFDIDTFIACFEGDGCPPGKTADFNGDDFVDFFDIDGYIAAFEAGC